MCFEKYDSLQNKIETEASESAELPAVATAVAQHKGGHGLISTPGLQLVVRGVSFPTLAALEGPCLRAP